MRCHIHSSYFLTGVYSRLWHRVVVQACCLCSMAGRFNDPCASVDYILQSGTKNLASVQYIKIGFINFKLVLVVISPWTYTGWVYELCDFSIVSMIGEWLILKNMKLIYGAAWLSHGAACCKAGPSSILGSAPQGGVSHWADKRWRNGERPQRMAMDKCIVWMWLNECMYVIKYEK